MILASRTRLAPLWVAALVAFSSACQTSGPDREAGIRDPVTPRFQKKLLQGIRLSSPTCLEFGPDGRLYVSQMNGALVALSIARTEDGGYRAERAEMISSLQRIPNHDDLGQLRRDVRGRLVTGLLLTGTPARPVIYATSSDPRLEASERKPWRVGFPNLDTNSGVVSRLTWNGSRWQRLDLVRGLPRSRLNHATNGLLLLPDGRTLLVAQGGNTNLGGPSTWLGLFPEYALSGAILAIDLQQIGETTYDLPTLDDEDRPGEPDANDPFGGNWGKNQAILQPGGPVQIYASGFRNPYDLLLSTNGTLYTIDNGSNAGWGGLPRLEGPEGRATNQPVVTPGGRFVDQLHVLTPGFYAGHPNPTRSNPANTFNKTNPQSPVTQAAARESDFRTPLLEDGALTTFAFSTNGMTEYVSSVFGGAWRGNLLAVSLANELYRLVLSESGDEVLLNEAVFRGIGEGPLDVVALGDDTPFPGSIWVADYLAESIVIFEPDLRAAEAMPAHSLGGEDP